MKLLADGEDTNKTLTLSSDNNWTSSFSELAKYKDGKEIVYTIEEVGVEGYEASIAGNAATGFTVANSHTPTAPPDESDDSASPSEIPQTGDHVDILLWISLLIISSVSLIGFLMWSRKLWNALMQE